MKVIYYFWRRLHITFLKERNVIFQLATADLPHILFWESQFSPVYCLHISVWNDAAGSIFPSPCPCQPTPRHSSTASTAAHSCTTACHTQPKLPSLQTAEPDLQVNYLTKNFGITLLRGISCTNLWLKVTVIKTISYAVTGLTASTPHRNNDGSLPPVTTSTQHCSSLNHWPTAKDGFMWFFWGHFSSTSSHSLTSCNI